MAEKLQELPVELEKALEAGDIDEAKRIYVQCEPNATYVFSNVFSLHPMPREFALFAKERGADINLRDKYGRTPIYTIVRRDGDIKLLAELGANVNAPMWDGSTPLHYAAQRGTKKAAKALLDCGAEVNARSKAYDGVGDLTPLELTLVSGELSSQKKLEMSKFFLKRGAEMTDRSRQFARAFSGAFVRHTRKKKDSPSLQKQRAALEELCALFEVEPMGADEPHDGISPILITYAGGSGKDSFRELWDYLVPPNGRAKTAQGEVIRLSGRIEDELMRNGGLNWESWDGDYRKMLYMLPRYFRYGQPLGEYDMNLADVAVEALKEGDVIDKEIWHLTICAKDWVENNPEVLPLLEGDYTG